MKRYFLPVLIIFVIIFASCYYDNEEALYPVYSNTCDTTNVTFSVTISSILNNSCLGCHSNAKAASWGNNIRLENHADVVAKITNVIGSIKHTGTFSQMPRNGVSLKPCSITQFDIWVRKGMPL
jgi:hypothetical protein